MCGNARSTNELNGREVFRYTVVDVEFGTQHEDTHQEKNTHEQEDKKPTPTEKPTKPLKTPTKPLVTSTKSLHFAPTCNDGFPEENSLPNKNIDDAKPTHFVPPSDERPTCAPPVGVKTTRPATKAKTTRPPPHCASSTSGPVRTRPTHPTFTHDVSKTRPTHPKFNGCPDDTEVDEKPTKTPPTKPRTRSSPPSPTKSPKKTPTKLPPTKPCPTKRKTTPSSSDSDKQHKCEEDDKPVTLKKPPEEEKVKPTEKSSKNQKTTEKPKDPILQSPLATEKPKVSKRPLTTKIVTYLPDKGDPTEKQPAEKPPAGKPPAEKPPAKKPQDESSFEEKEHPPTKKPLGPILESPLPIGAPELDDHPPNVVSAMEEFEAAGESTKPDEIKLLGEPIVLHPPTVVDTNPSEALKPTKKPESVTPDLDLEKKRMKMLQMLKSPIYSHPD